MPNSRRDGTSAKALKLDLGARLQRARKELGLTQSDVADEVGRSRELVQRWEDPRSERAPNVVDIGLSPRPIALVALDVGARAHNLRVLPVPALVHGEDDFERALSITKSAANATRAACMLLKVGITSDDLEMIEREFLKASESALEGVERVRLRLREVRGGR